MKPPKMDTHFKHSACLEIQDPLPVYTNISCLFSLRNKDSRTTNAATFFNQKRKTINQSLSLIQFLPNYL